MDNQQDYLFDNEQLQVLLTGTFGDGCISETKSNKGIYTTNCIYEEYMEYKSNLLKDIFNSKRSYLNMGYKQNMIYSISSKTLKSIILLHKKSLIEKLNLLDDLGLALWFYDDGSLHKTKHFYNLNTHSFSLEDHTNYLKPYFESKGYPCNIFQDKKLDGRIFYYLCFRKHRSGFKIAELLQKYPVNCYSYKRWSSEAIQKWSKLEAQLKSENKTLKPCTFTKALKSIVL